MIKELEKREVKSLPVLIKLFRENLEVMGFNLGNTETILDALRGKQNTPLPDPYDSNFPDGHLGDLEAAIHNFKRMNDLIRKNLAGIEVSVTEKGEPVSSPHKYPVGLSMDQMEKRDPISNKY